VHKVQTQAILDEIEIEIEIESNFTEQYNNHIE
jgi:hypothetical protein